MSLAEAGGMDFDDVVSSVSDGASSVWNTLSDGASSAVSAIGDGASSVVNTVESAAGSVADGASSVASGIGDAASSAVSAVGSGASSLMSTISDDASAAWNAVGSGLTSAKDLVIHGDADWTKNTELEIAATQRATDEQKARDANPEIQKFRKAQQDQNAHENSAHDAGFDSAQHMQDYSKATSDFQAAWDKINAVKDSDEAEKLRQKLGVPKSLDDYLRQQHIAPRGKPAY